MYSGEPIQPKIASYLPFAIIQQRSDIVAYIKRAVGWFVVKLFES